MAESEMHCSCCISGKRGAITLLAVVAIFSSVGFSLRRKSMVASRVQNKEDERMRWVTSCPAQELGAIAPSAVVAIS